MVNNIHQYHLDHEYEYLYNFILYQIYAGILKFDTNQKVHNFFINFSINMPNKCLIFYYILFIFFNMLLGMNYFF